MSEVLDRILAIGQSLQEILFEYLINRTKMICELVFQDLILFWNCFLQMFKKYSNGIYCNEYPIPISTGIP